jgi:beta-lactamase regulating signal transducer with metallopeptidase domain
MSLELAGIDWVGHGWRLLLAFTAAQVIVAMLRKGCRRLFGPERAFQLWALPPLALLASQLPHAAAVPEAALPPVVYVITAASTALPPADVGSAAIDWRSTIALLWLAGMVARLLAASIAQFRYRLRLRGAVRLDGLGLRWPVLRADRADIGPALVGAFRSCIVLPVDFESRYESAEQALIVAHETLHAQRHDGCWSLLAQFLAALFWFHPLTFWALAALRHDQELACDAAVLRQHGAQRRTYAHAMLKTQMAALALPVGCSWSIHPVKERIEMLKVPVPGRRRRRSGRVAMAALAIVTSAAVYAAQASPHTYQANADALAEALALSDGARAAVADYALHHDLRMPADNAAAALPDDPDLVNGKFVRRLAVQEGVVVVTLRAAPGSAATAGGVRWVPHAETATHSVTWSCVSTDIPSIAQLAPGCVYRPGPTASQGGPSATNYLMKLALGLDGQPARLHATACLRPGQYYETTQGGIASLAPWHARFTVVPAADGLLEVQGELSGGSLEQTVYPKIRTHPGQEATIQIGRQDQGEGGKVSDRTLKAVLTPTIGC